MKKTITSLILAAGIALAGCSSQPQPKQLTPSIYNFYPKKSYQNPNSHYDTDVKQAEIKKINVNEPDKLDISEVLDSL